jgi:FkbM family methyltransferase
MNIFIRSSSCTANTCLSMKSLVFFFIAFTFVFLLVRASDIGSCAQPVFLRIQDAPIAFNFAVPSGDAGGYYIDALKRSGNMVPVASCILADALRSLCKAKQPRGVFVDVGAHVGWFSAMAASHGCDVVSIEPQDRATTCIQATVAANAAEWHNVSISVVRSAAGRESGSAMLSSSASSPDWALASVDFSSSDQSSSLTTRVVRIDDAVEDALGRDALSRVVAVKVDVEGAEVNLQQQMPLFAMRVSCFAALVIFSCRKMRWTGHSSASNLRLLFFWKPNATV